MEFYEHLKKYLNNDEIDDLKKSLNQDRTYALLLNEDKMKREDFISLFPHVVPHPIVPNGFLYNKEEYDFGKMYLHEMGVYYLQEPSAMVVSYLLNPKENDTVLDLCAAPGGKTVQASLLMKQSGCLYSNDLSKQRCQVLLENVERMGLSNVIICNNDFEEIYKNYLNFFDKIIIDAPCSGSGMFRKDSKMIQDWSYAKVQKFADIQKHLIQIAFDMLKPGGEMIYSTCSLSYEEDEEVIQNLFKNNDDAEQIELNNDLFYVDRITKLGIHLLSFKFNGEGHYICKIKKKNEKNVFFSNHKSKNYTPSKVSFGDYSFVMPNSCKTDKLNLIRYGVKCYEKKGKDLVYCHHLSHSQLAFSLDLPTCELNREYMRAYFNGLTLNIPCKKGFVLLTYKNIPFGFGKSDGKIIKNHYPKYLRNKNLI